MKLNNQMFLEDKGGKGGGALIVRSYEKLEQGGGPLHLPVLFRPNLNE